MKPATKLLHLGIIRRFASPAEVVEFHIYRYRHQFEFLRIKAAEFRHCPEERKRILACRNADGYLIALFYH